MVKMAIFLKILIFSVSLNWVSKMKGGLVLLSSTFLCHLSRLIDQLFYIIICKTKGHGIWLIANLPECWSS